MSLRYIFLRIATFCLRGLVKLLQGKATSFPDAVTYVPSREPHRHIKVHVYQSQQVVKVPGPVLVNFHGSGFIIPAHGSDDAFCREVSQRTNFTVLDVSYRLSPENPFPAAINDAEDVLRWVQAQPTLYDVSHIAVSGFSAGGNIALVMASTIFPINTFCCLLAFYPSTEPYIDAASLTSPQLGGHPLPTLVRRLFYSCYIRPEVDRRDPRISPGLANASSFPRKVLIITAGFDTLACEGERLAERLQEDPDQHVICERMDRCDHGWDKMAKKGTREWELRCKSYDLAVEILQL